ncbi:MAG: chemotaxis protein CheW [Geobacteraceae bacterium]
MNLAEIRKKARQEKSGAVSPTETPSTQDLDSPASAGTTEQSVSQVSAEEIFPEPSGGTLEESLSFAEMTEELSEFFDPAAIILAGRQSAGLASAVADNQQQESSEVSGEVLKYLRFRVANEEYGISLLQIREIIKVRDITEVPGMPGFVAGVLSLRGIIIPIFDLRLRLGLGTNEAPGWERIIIARMQERLFGLLVDEVNQVLNLSVAAIENAPTVLEGIDREFVSGIGRHGQRMLILLDLEKLVDISLL